MSNHRCASPSRPLSPMVLVTPPPRAAVQARRCHTVAVLGRRTSVPVSRILITKKVVLPRFFLSTFVSTVSSHMNIYRQACVKACACACACIDSTGARSPGRGTEGRE